MEENVAFYPYINNKIHYISTMLGFIEKEYRVIDYAELKNDLYSLKSVRTIYLNWIEYVLDNEDYKLLRAARHRHINIIWVFHNRIGHDVKDYQSAIANIQFLIKVSTKIIIHSKSSIKFLREYSPNINYKKVYFIPHPNFEGDYFSLGDEIKKIRVQKDEFVFAMYGYIRPFKNIELLIEAFKRICENYKCRLLIVGRVENEEYYNKLVNSSKGFENIIIRNYHINPLEMAAFLEKADVLVLPYDVGRSMNSGVMIMAFSYKKTVIVPDICMANDFDDSLFYKYQYDSENEHIEKLYCKMEEACLAGKVENAEKGKALYEEVYSKNSKEIVCKELLNLVR